MQTQKLQSMPGRTINSFARTNNVKPIERCCPCLRKRKKRVEMPNLLAKMSTGRKMVATVPKKAGINNRKMTCVGKKHHVHIAKSSRQYAVTI